MSPIYWPLTFLILAYLIISCNSLVTNTTINPTANNTTISPTTNNNLNW